eukprot:jgi/Botrbrau1/11110/Bobra.0219s0019.1
MTVICKTRCKGFLLWMNAGKVGYGMYDDKLLDRIATLERKLGMPARTASWKPLMSKGAAVQHNGALSIPFGCNIFMGATTAGRGCEAYL